MNDEQSLLSRSLTLNRILNALNVGKSPLLIECRFVAALGTIFFAAFLSGVASVFDIGDYIKDKWFFTLTKLFVIGLVSLIFFNITMRIYSKGKESLRLDDFVFTLLANYNPVNKERYLHLQELAKKHSFFDIQTNIKEWAEHEKVHINELSNEADFLKLSRDNPKNKFVTREIKS